MSVPVIIVGVEGEARTLLLEATGNQGLIHGVDFDFFDELGLISEETVDVGTKVVFLSPQWLSTRQSREKLLAVRRTFPDLIVATYNYVLVHGSNRICNRFIPQFDETEGPHSRLVRLMLSHRHVDEHDFKPGERHNDEHPEGDQPDQVA